MQTRFRPEQLADPAIREADGILRSCVHCGFCTATCPTYVLLGDELDSPRGRIYLIKNMLEEQKVSPSVVVHIDRCLSCLSCMTTCPSGVDYMHLIDQARAFIERNHRRPLGDRLFRALVAALVPRPTLFRLASLAGSWTRPLTRWLPGRLGAMAASAPRSLPPPSPLDRRQRLKPQGRRRGRVALLSGCAQQVLAPEINEATVRLLLRMGLEVEVVPDARCCGALPHHMGKPEAARRHAWRSISAWLGIHRSDPLDAIVVNASGCGLMVKDYAHLFRGDREREEAAREVAGLARDLHEVVETFGLPPLHRKPACSVAWHAPCSLQHGLRRAALGPRLLAQAGFAVRTPAEAHLCCGSAGAYSLLQPDISRRLAERKADRLEATGADLVASANIGCILHLREATAMPVVHTVQLLDWATGGPLPEALDPNIPAGADEDRAAQPRAAAAAA